MQDKLIEGTVLDLQFGNELSITLQAAGCCYQLLLFDDCLLMHAGETKPFLMGGMANGEYLLALVGQLMTLTVSEVGITVECNDTTITAAGVEGELWLIRCLPASNAE